MARIPLGIKNASWVTERWGTDVPVNGFIRELYMNSLQAGATKIDWDKDDASYQLEGKVKLSIIDNGNGMTGEELENLLINLGAGTRQLGLDENFGIGAKISLMPQNPQGIIYLSRKNNINSMVRINRQDGQYGLEEMVTSDGKYVNHITVADDVMPSLIMKSGHGTAVILLGEDEEHNTLLPPEGVLGGQTNWLIKELNARIFKVPSEIDLRVNQYQNVGSQTEFPHWVKIKGNGDFLKKNSTSKGLIETSNGDIHWFIIDKKQQAQKNTGRYITAAHTGVLYENEIYDLRTRDKAQRLLNRFGITLGYKSIAIYVEPNEKLKARPNSVRTKLEVSGRDFPWDIFAEEFRKNMPDAITKLESDIIKKSSRASSNVLLGRLKERYSFFRIPHYRPHDEGTYKTDITPNEYGGQSKESGNKSTDASDENDEHKASGESGGNQGSIWEIFESEQSKSPAKRVRSLQVPRVTWVSPEEGDVLEDKAAQYNPPLIRANEDFRIFKCTESEMKKKYSKTPISSIVGDIVRDHYEAVIQEVILRAEMLRGSKNWSNQSIDRMTNEDALTGAVLPVLDLIDSIEKDIENRIKEAKKAA